MEAFEKVFVRLNQILVALFLASIFIVVFTNVVMRYGFGASLAWGEEVARFLMIAGAFIGSGLALREGRLVSIDFFQELLPENLKSLVRWFLVFLMALLMIILVWLGIRFSIFGWDKETMATQIPRGVPYLAIPIGAAFFLVHLVLFARRFINHEFVHEDFESQQSENKEDK